MKRCAIGRSRTLAKKNPSGERMKISASSGTLARFGEQSVIDLLGVSGYDTFLAMVSRGVDSPCTKSDLLRQAQATLPGNRELEVARQFAERA